MINVIKMFGSFIFLVWIILISMIAVYVCVTIIIDDILNIAREDKYIIYFIWFGGVIGYIMSLLGFKEENT